jgi:hypothetical protein
MDLEKKCSELQEWQNYYTQRLSLIENLEGIGFGFKELKSLWHTIVEISDANNISREDAVKGFSRRSKTIMMTYLGSSLGNMN